MTPAKRLFEMKKELKTLKKKMDKENRKAVKYNRKPRVIDDYIGEQVPYYVFIMKDGTVYGIDMEELSFPDINVNDVVYITKKIYGYNKKHKKHTVRHYDTLKGSFAEYPVSYMTYIQQKFNAKPSEYVYYQ